MQVASNNCAEQPTLGYANCGQYAKTEISVELLGSADHLRGRRLGHGVYIPTFTPPR